MKVLFLALSCAGFGETLIGLALARQLARRGGRVHFVIDSAGTSLVGGVPFPVTVLEPQMGPLVKLIVDSLVSEMKPDAIVLADYFTYCGVFSKRYHVDPWFIDAYDIPILPVDIWEWDKTPFAIDVYVGKQLQVSRRFMEMGAWLRPVPLCHLSPADPRAFRFSLRDGTETISARTRHHLRTTLGLSRSDRLVLLALAKWQMPNLSDENGNACARAVPALIADYLRELPSNVHFVNVGQRVEALETLGAGRVHHLPACAPNRFNVLVGSADLFLGLNIGATTLTRAVMGGVPGLVLVNGRTVASPDDADRVAGELGVGVLTDTVRTWLAAGHPVYPFRMWPLGFHAFLEPLLTGNPYLETFRQVEVLDHRAVIDTLDALLFDRSAIAAIRQAQEAYVAQLDSLPGGAEAVEAAAQTCGAVVR